MVGFDIGSEAAQVIDIGHSQMRVVPKQAGFSNHGRVPFRRVCTDVNTEHSSRSVRHNFLLENLL